MKLKSLVMISGPNDTVITPWQSAHLGFCDQNEVVQPFEKQQVTVQKCPPSSDYFVPSWPLNRIGKVLHRYQL